MKVRNQRNGWDITWRSSRQMWHAQAGNVTAEAHTLNGLELLLDVIDAS